MIISFLGHSQFNATKEYEQEMLSIFEKNIGTSAVNFYLGGYGDFDNFAYDCCKAYQKTNPNVSLKLITPYITLSYQRNHLTHQVNRYDDIIYPEIEDKPLRLAILYRNKWMVEKADCIICGICHPWGGAYKAYQYAKQKRKKIYNITGKEL